MKRGLGRSNLLLRELRRAQADGLAIDMNLADRAIFAKLHLKVLTVNT